MPPEETKLPDGRIVRSETPLNLEMPFSSLDSFITPTNSFYVRTHFPIPAIDRNAWWLHVEGEVEKPFGINYEQLMALQSVTAPATLECAGNNRNFLEPKVKGVQWHLGAVGTAEWTGVLLSALLDRAIPKPNACEVALEGADRGILEDPKSPPGEFKFARSIPLEKACRDVLLAYKMNGQDLPPEHGFPLRAIVPGWYAMASVKWLAWRWAMPRLWAKAGSSGRIFVARSRRGMAWYGRTRIPRGAHARERLVIPPFTRGSPRRPSLRRMARTRWCTSAPGAACCVARGGPIASGEAEASGGSSARASTGYRKRSAWSRSAPLDDVVRRILARDGSSATIPERGQIQAGQEVLAGAEQDR